MQHFMNFIVDLRTELSSFFFTAYSKRNYANLALFFLWGIGVIVAIAILISLLYFDNKAALISAFAILISAFMASVAMLKSIQRSEHEHRDRLFNEKSKTVRNLYYGLISVYSVYERFQIEPKRLVAQPKIITNQLIEDTREYVDQLSHIENYLYLNDASIEQLYLLIKSLKAFISQLIYFEHALYSNEEFLQRISSTLESIVNINDDLIQKIELDLSQSVNLPTYISERSKLFIGKRIGSNTEVTFDDQPLPLCLNIKNHSPLGFEWGYDGSGARQLALAILHRVLEKSEQAELLYDTYCNEVIYHLDKSFWSISKAEVLDWIRMHQSDLAN